MKCGHVSPSAHDKAVNYPTHSLVVVVSGRGEGAEKDACTAAVKLNGVAVHLGTDF